MGIQYLGNGCRVGNQTLHRPVSESGLLSAWYIYCPLPLQVGQCSISAP